jgi:hypothetical protein
MAGKVAVPTERVPLVATATGETVLVWPVDAREMLANGDYITPAQAAQDAAVVTDGEATGESSVAAVVPDGAATEPTKRKR